MTFQDGVTLFKSGDYSAAAEHFHQVTQENEKNHKAWNALGICLSKMGRYSDANTCFTYAIRLGPDNDTYKKNKRNNEVYLKKEEEDIFSLDVEPDFNQKINGTQKNQKLPDRNEYIRQKKSNSQNIQPTYKFWGLFVLSILLLFIPVIGSFISIIIILISTYLVYADAKGIGVGNPNATDSSMRWSPGTWAAAVFLLWIFFLPYYAYKRDKWIIDYNDDLGYYGPYTRSLLLIIIIVIFVLIPILVLGSAVIAAFVFGMTGSVDTTKNVAFISELIEPQEDAVIIKNYGGRDISSLVSISASDGSNPLKENGLDFIENNDYLNVGDSFKLSFNNKQNKRVILIGKFNDGTDSILLDKAY